MICRICGAGSATQIGEVEYYKDFAWPIFDCASCGCRFTKHDDSTYEWLHRQAGSTYGLYRELLERYKPLFDRGDLVALGRELSHSSKYRFIVEAVNRSPKDAGILEVGCSRGYLTSYAILARRDVLGCDVSAEAVRAATAAFGNHFAEAGSPVIRERAPYDMIYHVGTIGCVADPIGMTRGLLDLLKPGGRLLFNAPNADGCWLKEQLWLDAAPPPDLVTLFRPGFWRKHFSAVADVTEEIESCPTPQAFDIGLKTLCGRRWQKPEPLLMENSLNDFKGTRAGTKNNSGFWHQFERCARAAARITRTNRLAPAQPSPFGLFVTMRKKSGIEARS